MKDYKIKKTYEVYSEIISKKNTHGSVELAEQYELSPKTIRRWLKGDETILPDGRIINKSSPILNTISTEELQNTINSCSSLSSVIRFFGLQPRPCYFNMLNKRIENENISTIQMKINYNNILRITNDEDAIKSIFVKNSQAGMRQIKRLIIKYNLIEYKCTECGNEGFHNNKPLVLQVDHIDGDNRNNNLENLRYICPNCHTQTETFTGRNRRKIKSVKEETRCEDCGKLIQFNKTFCSECLNEKDDITKETNKVYCSPKRMFNPSVEELTDMLSKFSLTVVGNYYNVSRNTIKNRCEILGIDYKELMNNRKSQLKQNYNEGIENED